MSRSADLNLIQNTHSRHHDHDKLAPPGELQELDVMKTKMTKMCYTLFFKWCCFKISLRRLILPKFLLVSLPLLLCSLITWEGLRHEERRWGWKKLRIERRCRASTTSMDPERTIKTWAHTRTTSGTLTEGWEITEWRWQHFCHNELMNHNIGLSLCYTEYTISELKNQIFHFLSELLGKSLWQRQQVHMSGTSYLTAKQPNTGSSIALSRSYLPPCPAPCPAWTRPLHRATAWSTTQPTAAAGTCRPHEDETENKNKPWDDLKTEESIYIHMYPPLLNITVHRHLICPQSPPLFHSEQLSWQTHDQIFLRNVKAVVLPDISVVFASSFV